MNTAAAKREILTRVEKSGGHWLWTGAYHKGYPNIIVEYKGYRAHRLTYTLWKGPIPKGFVVDHVCRVVSCVRPRHLEAVTDLENKRRGMSPSAINARKTHCKRGHPFNKRNTRSGLQRNGNPGRICRRCNRERMRRYKQVTVKGQRKWVLKEALS